MDDAVTQTTQDTQHVRRCMRMARLPLPLPLPLRSRPRSLGAPARDDLWDMTSHVIFFGTEFGCDFVELSRRCS